MKKKIFKVFVISILIFIVSFLSVQGLIINEKNQNYDVQVDYVIVLGARLYGDIPSPTLKFRLNSALDYLENYSDPKVIVTGGQGSGESITEALAMKTYLENKGVNSHQIILEDKSTSTFENLNNSIDKINELTSNKDIKILIVSSDYHLFRAKMIARQFDLTIYTKGSKVPPSVLYKAYIREYFAVIKSLIFDRI
ncbi:MAG TPA: YdcF family protein [Erysipelotrichaceae bacterium]|nr:YdcF family protein [Erysipelotrichaceae bacterium]